MDERSSPRSVVRPELRARLEAVADGPEQSVRFDRYMEVVLYDPGVGYYARGERPPGPQGDFFTAVQLRPLFARALAARILSEYDRLERPDWFRVVEVGAGDGTLAADLVNELAPSLRPNDRLTYVLIERSPTLREAALERLTSIATDHPQIEVRVAEAVGADGPMEGVVLANEFLDAQPCRRLRWRASAWTELAVGLRPEGLAWVERDAADPVPGPALPPGERDGLVVEISSFAEAFVREVGDHLAAGSAILLDYGDEESGLRGSRPRGTLTALRAHEVVDDVLGLPGEVDLGAFVNFSRIRAVAQASGLNELGYDRQANALGHWGLPAIVERSVRGLPSVDEVRLRLQAKRLMFDFENFRVLELGPPPFRAA